MAKNLAEQRCPWCGDDPLYTAYHDEEWGTPLYDSQKLFEFINLEGMQAGLSWITILRKRNAICTAFADFNPEKLARFSEAKQSKLLENPNIIRNRLKVQAAIGNAKAYFKILEQHQSFADFIWQFTDGEPIINNWRSMKHVPTSTTISKNMSKTLKQYGFRFVGETICYAYMQAVGMVNDHLISCYLHPSNQ